MSPFTTPNEPCPRGPDTTMKTRKFHKQHIVGKGSNEAISICRWHDSRNLAKSY